MRSPRAWARACANTQPARLRGADPLASCVWARRGVEGVPPWAPGSSLLPSGAAGPGLVLGSSSAVLPAPGQRVHWAPQNYLLVLRGLALQGQNGSLGFILLRAGRRKRLTPQGRARGAPRRGVVAGSGFGVVTSLCSIVPGATPRRDGPFVLL